MISLINHNKLDTSQNIRYESNVCTFKSQFCCILDIRGSIGTQRKVPPKYATSWNAEQFDIMKKIFFGISFIDLQTRLEKKHNYLLPLPWNLIIFLRQETVKSSQSWMDFLYKTMSVLWASLNSKDWLQDHPFPKLLLPMFKTVCIPYSFSPLRKVIIEVSEWEWINA